MSVKEKFGFVNPLRIIEIGHPYLIQIKKSNEPYMEITTFGKTWIAKHDNKWYFLIGKWRIEVSRRDINE